MKKRFVSIFSLVWFLGISFWIPLSYADNPLCIENGPNCEDRAPVAFTGTYSPVSSSSSSPQGASVTQTMLQVGGGDNSANGDTNVTFKDNFLRNIQIYIVGLLGIVSVSVFLYIGYMLFTAQGKEEDFKNAWKALTYAVVGLAVIPLAFIAVKIVTGFTF
ncbi:MAG: pilin [Candidatus Gracilibacteria bacterium]|nr:pilin [Candidatus Gracilibacteria bacterium]